MTAYLLADATTKEGVLIDPVVEMVRLRQRERKAVMLA
jgi:hypothetical protein